MQSILVSDQYSENSASSKREFGQSYMPVMETALQHAQMNKLAANTAAGLGVTLVEMPVTGLLVLRAGKDADALRAAVKSKLQLELPDTLGSSVNGDQCLRWIAPDEWMLSCVLNDVFGIETTLRDAVQSLSKADASVAMVNVSGGFTALMLFGPHALDVLRKSTAYDVHPSNFVPGKVVNTVFAKAQVCLRCIDENQYELIVRRSFADYLWHWLQVASNEYGLSIEVS